MRGGEVVRRGEMEGGYNGDGKSEGIGCEGTEGKEGAGWERVEIGCIRNGII